MVSEENWLPVVEVDIDHNEQPSVALEFFPIQQFFKVVPTRFLGKFQVAGVVDVAVKVDVIPSDLDFSVTGLHPAKVLILIFWTQVSLAIPLSIIAYFIGNGPFFIAYRSDKHTFCYFIWISGAVKVSFTFVKKDFEALIERISYVHQGMQANANRAINQSLTIRNWMIGMYIIEFEQNGANRAEYGGHLLKHLAKKLTIRGLTAPELSRCRQFYQCYPQIQAALQGKFRHRLPAGVVETLKDDEFVDLSAEKSTNRILGTLSQEFQYSNNKLFTPAEQLLKKLSYSHFVELLKIDDQLKRTFYELESIKGTWSVRELKRQIETLFFERSGFLANPEEFIRLIQSQIHPPDPHNIVKDLYTFEFLDIPEASLLEESTLEAALLNNLQKFILELGNGFCLEGRQKRILIGESYYFIDLLFYHRILKCHVLIELKVGAFTHAAIGQLNSYLAYYKAEVSEPNDNPPVGILMVGHKDEALVKFATAGLDENIFVQQYMLQLPEKTMLERYMMKELQKLAS